jgi:putative tricarboxylic transport membrane protein
MKPFRNKLISALPLIASLLIAPGVSSAFELERTVEFVSHASPGSGGDLVAQKITQILGTMLPVPVELVIHRGGDGAVANNYIYEKVGDPHYLRLASPSLLTTPIRLDIDPLKMTPIATLGMDVALIVVRADSDFKTFQDLVDYAKENPYQLRTAGGMVGNHDSIFNRLLQEDLGVYFTYVPFGGSAEARTALLGGHGEYMLGNLAEIESMIAAGEFRPLAHNGAERLKLLPDVPTLAELGVKVSLPQFRGVFGAPELSNEALQYWGEVMQKVYESEEWQAFAESAGFTPVFIGPEEMKTDMATQVEHFTTQLSELGFLDK